MASARLNKAYNLVADWCDWQRVPFYLVCDETDMLAVSLRLKDQSLVRQLVADLQPLLTRYGVHMRVRPTRSGVVVTLSPEAVSESQPTAHAAEAGDETGFVTFEDKLNEAIATTVAETAAMHDGHDETDIEQALLASAVRIAEGQYKAATQGATRANQTSLQRQRIGSNLTLGGASNPPLDGADAGYKATTGMRQRPRKLAFEDHILSVFGSRPCPQYRTFWRNLSEALDGMATATDQQPKDLFVKFARALVILGQRMGIGSLQQRLKDQGISWKKSNDGQSLILYLINAQTGAPQPIARISAEALEKPSDFETQLLNVLDFAKGNAPGTFRQRRQEMQAQERMIRDIVKSMGIGNNDVNQAGTGQAGAGQVGVGDMMPAAVAGNVNQPIRAMGSRMPAPLAAATQAALPKPGSRPPVRQNWPHRR